jgi:hypothetical protein
LYALGVEDDVALFNVYGQERKEDKMTNCPTAQLNAVILLKHLTRLTESWGDEAIDLRLEELDAEQIENPEHRKLYGEYSQLIDRIEHTGDQELRYNALFELDIVVGDLLAETGRFHYLAGINDAARAMPNLPSAI